MAEAAAAVTTLIGRYRPLRPLGSGGSGSVWHARDERTGREVALKMVQRAGTAGARAEREASAAAQLDHPNCLRAYALSRDERHVYIAYEYVPGRTLREALSDRTLDDEDAVEAAAQVLDGLAHAHARGIVHRDVKPANVLLADGPRISARLLDFGLALVTEEETLTAVGDVPGTLAYISPERLHGRQAGPAADVWSVGVLLWEGLAGRHPFGSGTFLELAKRIGRGAPPLARARPDLPKALTRLVDAALATEPGRRPSARKLAAGLRRVQSGRHELTAAGPALHHVGRIAAALAAALYTGWTSATFPFFPEHWPVGLAAAAAFLSLASPRVGLALALAVPILPFGNLSSGLAVLYGLAATCWLACFWTRPRSALFFVAGPLLAPVFALGLLPAVALLAGTWPRRALTAAAGAIAATIVSGTRPLDVAGLERPLEVLDALRAAAGPALVPLALVLAGAAVALPYARKRGPWPATLFGAAVIAATLLAAPDLPWWPFVASSWLLAAALALEPRANPSSRRFRLRAPALARH